MDERQSDERDDRLERLERELTKFAELHKAARREIQHLKWVVVVMVLASCALVFAIGSIRSGAIELKDVLGTAMPKKLESKEFGLYNRLGKRVLFADYDKWGYPSLVFLDLDLNYRMGLKIYGDGSPGMVFYDGTGTRASFRMGEKGESLFQLLGQKQKGGILMEVSPEGVPHLKMSDALGKVVFEAPEVTTSPVSGPSPTPVTEPGPSRLEKPRGPRR